MLVREPVTALPLAATEHLNPVSFPALRASWTEARFTDRTKILSTGPQTGDNGSGPQRPCPGFPARCCWGDRGDTEEGAGQAPHWGNVREPVPGLRQTHSSSRTCPEPVNPVGTIPALPTAQQLGDPPAPASRAQPRRPEAAGADAAAAATLTWQFGAHGDFQGAGSGQNAPPVLRGRPADTCPAPAASAEAGRGS